MQNNLAMTDRSADRSKTRIFGTVKYFGQESLGRVVDLSATGMALELQQAFSAGIGSRVTIDSADLGVIEGTIKWYRGSRVGIELKLSSNTLAQLSSYFRFFHQDIRPVLAR